MLTGLLVVTGNEYFGSVVGQPYQNRFNHGWLGVTLDLHHIDNTDLVAVSDATPSLLVPNTFEKRFSTRLKVVNAFKTSSLHIQSDE